MLHHCVKDIALKLKILNKLFIIDRDGRHSESPLEFARFIEVPNDEVRLGL